MDFVGEAYEFGAAMKKIPPIEWTPDLVRRFWSAVSNSPMRQYSFSLLNAKRLIQYVKPWVSTENEHLDFGAGDGDFIREMLKEGYPCAAYEVAGGRAEQYPDLRPYPGFLGVVDSDSDRRFDVVFMLDVIEHVLNEEMEKTLSLLRRFVKPGGLLIVSTPNNEDLDENYCICPQCMHSFHRWQHMRSYSENNLKQVLDEYGFDRVASHRVDFSANVQLEEQLKSMKREVEFYRNIYSSGWARRLYRALFPLSPPHEIVRDVDQGGDLSVGDESHLIYIARRVG